MKTLMAIALALVATAGFGAVAVPSLTDQPSWPLVWAARVDNPASGATVTLRAQTKCPNGSNGECNGEPNSFTHITTSGQFYVFLVHIDGATKIKTRYRFVFVPLGGQVTVTDALAGATFTPGDWVGVEFVIGLVPNYIQTLKGNTDPGRNVMSPAFSVGGLSTQPVADWIWNLDDAGCSNDAIAAQFNIPPC